MDSKEYRKIAHRGFHSSDAPENSMAAFAKAIENKYTIELDIHITKDGTLVIFHDFTLVRMTGIKKDIEDCTYKELSTYKLNNTEEKIPTLKEVLRQVNGSVPLLLEIKNNGIPGKLEKELIRMLRKYKGKYMVQSFNLLSLIYLRKNAPHIKRGKLATKVKRKFPDKLTDMFLTMEAAPNFISYKLEDVTMSLINKCKIQRKPLFVWTVRTKEDYLKAKKKYSGVIFENIKI